MITKRIGPETLVCVSMFKFASRKCVICVYLWWHIPKQSAPIGHRYLCLESKGSSLMDIVAHSLWASMSLQNVTHCFE